MGEVASSWELNAVPPGHAICMRWGIGLSAAWCSGAGTGLCEHAGDPGMQA